MRLTSPSWAAYALIMGRCCTGYTAISGAMPGMTHSYQTHGLLAAAWGHQSSYGYGLFEAEIPSEKMRWIRSLWGAECAAEGVLAPEDREALLGEVVEIAGQGGVRRDHGPGQIVVPEQEGGHQRAELE